MVLPAIAAGAAAGARTAGAIGKTAVRGATKTTRSAAKTGGRAAPNGVRNPQLMKREAKTVSGRFLNRQNVQSLAGRRVLTAAEKRRQERDRTHTWESVGTGLTQKTRRSFSQKLSRRVKVGAKRSVSRVLNSVVLSIVSFIAYWQVVFGLFAIMLIATGNVEILWGLFKVDTFVPASSSGWSFYALAFILTVGGYLLVLGIFLFQKINVFKKTELALATLIFLALDLTPVIQIFPWMLIWVFLVYGSQVSLRRKI